MKRKKKIMIVLLLVCLLCTNVLSTVVKAEDSQPKDYFVTDFYTFRNAIQEAKDGDIISVHGGIDIKTSVHIGSVDKHLTIKRGDAYSFIDFNVGISDATNITFDGCGRKSATPFIQSSMNTTFNNCTFQNCSNRESLLGGSGGEGGAIRVLSGSCVFNDCLFSDNYGIVGGSIVMFDNSQVEINHCIIKNGGASSNGGAVAVLAGSTMCKIVDSEITNNQARDFGGGVSNGGTLTITGSKIYGNSAVNGGADVATKITGNTTLTDTVEQLNELFNEEKLKVNGWVCDYDFEENIFMSDIDLTQENALLKLDYEEIKEEPTDPPTEPPTEEPGTDPTEPSTEEPGETPPTDETPDQPDTEEPDKEQPDTEEPGTKPGDQPSTENPDDGDEEPTTKPESPSTPSNVENIITDSNNTDNSTDIVNNNNDNSVVNNNDTDRSDNSVKSNDSYTTNTTTNNYYPAEGSSSEQQAAVPNVIVVRDGDDGNYSASGGRSAAVGVTGKDFESSQEQVSNDNVPNIKIDAQGVDCNFEYGEDGYNISIKANQAEQKDDEKISWYQIIQTGLLFAIFICLIWKPKKKES